METLLHHLQLEQVRSPRGAASSKGSAQLQAHPSLCSMPRHSLLPGGCLEEGRVQE